MPTPAPSVVRAEAGLVTLRMTFGTVRVGAAVLSWHTERPLDAVITRRSSARRGCPDLRAGTGLALRTAGDKPSMGRDEVLIRSPERPFERFKLAF